MESSNKQNEPIGECLCALCAQEGNTCCQTNPAHAHLGFPLSKAEWQRLLPYANLVVASAAAEVAAHGMEHPNNDILRVQEQNEPAFTQALHQIFPLDTNKIDTLFPSDGTHFRLRTTAKGTCVLLSETGCVLPRHVRPWYCLLFPAWVVGQEFTLFTAATCLISQKAHSPEQGYALLDTNKEKVHSLYTGLRIDWGLDKILPKKLVK